MKQNSSLRPKLHGRITEIEENTKIKLDIKDKKIIALLAEDARMPLAQIAKQVSLSRDAVDYRIKQLIAYGLIIGFVPVLMLKKFGYYWFHVYLLLDETQKEKQNELINALKNHPNIRSVMEYSDRWDIEFILIAENSIEFDSIVTEIISNRAGIILEKSMLEVIKYYKSIHIPNIFYQHIFEQDKHILKNIGESNLSPEEIKTQYSLDFKDIQILNILSKNCRVSTYNIAEKINLSADAISYRIKRMINDGYIEKFTLILNLSMLNYEWYTFAIQIKTLNKDNERKFREFVRNNPYIIRAVKVLGRWDLLLYIVTDNAAAFHHTIKEIKSNFADIINSYQTWSAYKEHTYNHFPMILETKYKKKKVLVFGTFDLLHPGHLQLFKDAKKYGDHLTVVVSRNSTVKKVKGSLPKYDEADRLEHVEAIDIVDEAMLGSIGDKYEMIQEIHPDIICLGYDQHNFTDKLAQKLKEMHINPKIVRLQPYKEHKYKSSKLKEEDK